MLGPSKLELQVTVCIYPKMTDKQQLKGLAPCGRHTAQHGRQAYTQRLEAVVTWHLVRKKSGPETLPGSKSPRPSAVSHFLHHGSTS